MRVALIASHGGHLMELHALRNAWEGAEEIWITYRSPTAATLPDAYLLPNIGLNPIRMLGAAIRLALIFARTRPDVVISTGAEVAIPAFYLAHMLGIRTIFIEVWTRVTRPTRTGKIVYPVSSVFFVQWPEMKERYGPRARHIGSLL